LELPVEGQSVCEDLVEAIIESLWVALTEILAGIS